MVYRLKIRAYQSFRGGGFLDLRDQRKTGFGFDAECCFEPARGSEASLKRAMQLFHGSISYLAVIFLLVGLDPFVV